MNLSDRRVKAQLKELGYSTRSSAYDRAKGRYGLRVRKHDAQTVSVFVDLDDDDTRNAKCADDVMADLQELGYDVQRTGSTGFRLHVTQKSADH